MDIFQLVVDGQPVGFVQLRWSGRCETVWARVQNQTGQNSLKWRVYLKDAAHRIINGTEYDLDGLGGYGQMVYEPSVGATTAVAACAVIEGYPEFCTGIHY